VYDPLWSRTHHGREPVLLQNHRLRPPISIGTDDIDCTLQILALKSLTREDLSNLLPFTVAHADMLMLDRQQPGILLVFGLGAG
jgi:hypothetical protein